MSFALIGIASIFGVITVIASGAWGQSKLPVYGVVAILTLIFCILAAYAAGVTGDL